MCALKNNVNTANELKRMNEHKETLEQANGKNQNLHETNMILTENLYSTVFSFEISYYYNYITKRQQQQRQHHSNGEVATKPFDSYKGPVLVMEWKACKQKTSTGIFWLCVIVCNTFAFVLSSSTWKALLFAGTHRLTLVRSTLARSLTHACLLLLLSVYGRWISSSVLCIPHPIPLALCMFHKFRRFSTVIINCSLWF